MKINKQTINKNTETLIDASKEVGLEVNTEKTKCMLVSHDQNAGQNQVIKIGKIEAKIKYIFELVKQPFFRIMC
jgi:hypothetical protein